MIVKNIIQSKKGMELSLSTIVIFIILLITFIVVVYFFVSHYGDGAKNLTDVGGSAITNARNIK